MAITAGFIFRIRTALYVLAVSLSTTCLIFSCGGKKDTEGRSGYPVEPALPVVPEIPQPAHARFFLENSGSVLQYFRNPADIRQAIAWTLNQCLLKCDSTSLYLINTQAFPVTIPVRQFAQNLTPGILQIGNTASSDLNGIFESVLAATGPDELGFLVTDGIYDISGTPQEVNESLNVAKIFTSTVFRRHVNSNPRHAVWLFRLVSHVNGNYYPIYGNTQSLSINQPRPYYLLIFGDYQLIRAFLNGEEFVNGLMGLTNSVVFFRPEHLDAYYSIVPLWSVGSFKYDRVQLSDRIVNLVNSARSTRKGETGFGFSIAFDFSEIPEDPAYFSDPLNYSVGNGYVVAKIRAWEHLNLTEKNGIQNALRPKTKMTPTHIIQISTTGSPLGELKVSLHKNLPSWVEDFTTYDDSNIRGDTLSTIWLKDLVESISGGYGHSSHSMEYLESTFSIK